MGVKRVNVGLDAGDHASLISHKHGIATPEINKKALENAFNAGLTVHASFVAGAKGETKKSLECTCNFIKDIVEKYHSRRPFFSSIEFSLLAPLPGSFAWHSLKEAFPFIGKDGTVDMEMVKGLWLEKFTHIDKEFAARKIAETDNFLSSYGIVTGKKCRMN